MMNQIKHIRSLDGLRGVAALIVFLAHFSGLTQIPGGGTGAAHIGVMIFFCLSGYLMGHLYFPIALDGATVAEFFRRRLARIAPLFVFVVLASFALTQAFDDWKMWAYQIKDWTAVGRHFFLVRGVSVLWTVVVEVQFYLLFPLFWFIARRSAKVALMVSVAGIGAVFAYQQVFTTEDTRVTTLFYTGHLFLIGLAVSIILPRITLLPRAWNMLFAASVAATLALHPSLELVNGLAAGENAIRETVQQMYASPVYAFVLAALLASSISSDLARRTLGSRPLRWLGTVSYSVYLLHMPTIWWLNRFTELGSRPLLFFAVATIVVLLVSSTSYVLIERPCRRAIVGFRPSPRTQPAI